MRESVEPRGGAGRLGDGEGDFPFARGFVADGGVKDARAFATDDDGAGAGLVVVLVAAAPFILEADDGAVRQVGDGREAAQGRVFRRSSEARKSRSSSGRSSVRPAKRALRTNSLYSL